MRQAERSRQGRGESDRVGESAMTEQIAIVNSESKSNNVNIGRHRANSSRTINRRGTARLEKGAISAAPTTA